MDIPVSAWRRGVAFVALDHGPVNLFDGAAIGDLAKVGWQLENVPDVKVVVLRSANPDFFIAHADLRLIGTWSAVALAERGIEGDLVRVEKISLQSVQLETARRRMAALLL